MEISENGKILVAYFSRPDENYAVGRIRKGNTQLVAEMIAAETGGALFRIVPAVPYPADYTPCTETARQEKDRRARPAIDGDAAVEEYDTIFLGYPNWWGDLPMPVYTFIEKHDWRGKTVIPFCTHEGSGLSDTESRIARACKGADVKRGLAMHGTTAQHAGPEAAGSVREWLGNLNF